MPAHEQFVLSNKDYASTFDKGALPLPPAKHYIVGKSILARSS